MSSESDVEDAELNDHQEVSDSFTRASEPNRLLHSLDRQQHTELAAHLYSAWLLRRESLTPGVAWVSWPIKNPANPPDLDPALPAPGIVSEEDIWRRKKDAQQGHPSRFSPTQDALENEQRAEEVLFQASEAFLQHEVERRVLADHLVPVIDPPPLLGSMKPMVLDVAQQYLKPIRNEPLRSTTLDWTHLAIDHPGALARLERLFGPRSRYKRPSGRKPRSRAEAAALASLEGDIGSQAESRASSNEDSDNNSADNEEDIANNDDDV